MCEDGGRLVLHFLRVGDFDGVPALGEGNGVCLAPKAFGGKCRRLITPVGTNLILLR
jgi:hypothetical protein